MAVHAGRAHSKFAASASERIHHCPGSVALSEGIADKPNQWSVEGERAHEVLEAFFNVEKAGELGRAACSTIQNANAEMFRHGKKASDFILNLHRKAPGSDLFIETRVYLDFIHPEMFGTLDSCVADHFGTLHILDYKYGVSPVSPKENLQLLFYALGVAHLLKWNFKRVRLWVIQPRIKGYDGPAFWEISILELKAYVKTFADAVTNVERNPNVYTEGKWCHWCKAKGICPIKTDAKLQAAKMLFAVGG